MIISKTISTRLNNALRVIKVVCLGKLDVREANESMPFGLDSNPVAGMQAIYGDTVSNGSPVIIGYINTNQVAGVGESRIYSTDESGNVVAQFHLFNNGKISLKNGSVDFNTILTNILTHIQALTVPTPSGTSGAPLNITDFQQDLKDIQQLWQ